jgi:hypothetical protein
MMQFTTALAHYFYPRYSNNHKAKLVHSSTLILISFFLVIYQFLLQVLPGVNVRVLGYAANISPEVVVSLTNQKRLENGLGEVTHNSDLARAAKAKGEDMLAKDYWAHVAPDGTEPWKFFADVSYKYKYAGENLARDFSDPQSSVEAWMASTSHRENMLSAKYKEIGVAVVEGDLNGVDTTIIIQLFGTKMADAGSVPVAQAKAALEAPVISSTPTPAPAVVAQTLNSPTPTMFLAGPLSGGSTNAKTTTSLFSPLDLTRVISLITVSVLSLTFVIDAVVVYRKRIPRVSGRVLAHLAFLGMIFSIILIAKAGKII